MLTGAKLSADEVLAEAAKPALASDAFDVAIEGFAELVASGDFDGAERVAQATFEHWEWHLRHDAEWAAEYAAPPE